MRIFISLVYLLSLLCTSVHGKTVYFVPYPGDNPQLSFYHPFSSQDEFAKKWCHLREALEHLGYTVKFTSDAQNLTDVYAIISITNTNARLLYNLKSYPRERCWLLSLEPPTYMPHLYEKNLTQYFGKNFVMFDDLVDNKQYFKFYYPQPRQKMKENVPHFLDKKLCALVAGNKKSSHPQELYSERKKVISYFAESHADDFDLYGHGWENYSSWRGSIKRKWDILQHYRFCFCYENMKDQQGYITEKIFDCFIAGCVPVYFGASNITKYIPKECFIDRRAFASEEDVYLFLKRMYRHTYESYLQAITRYLDSPAAQLYSIDYFIKIITHNLEILEAKHPSSKPKPSCDCTS